MFELEYIEEYLNQIESVLGDTLKGMDEEFHKLKKDLSPEEQDDLADAMHYDYHLLSYISHITSLLDHIICLRIVREGLRSICRNLEKSFNKAPFDQSQSNGKQGILNKYRNYLVNDIGVREFPDNSMEWKKILGVYRVIRNAFTHNDGRLKKSDYDKYKKEIGILSVTIDKDLHSVTLHKEFCYQLIEDVKNFYNILFDDLTPNYFQIRRLASPKPIKPN